VAHCFEQGIAQQVSDVALAAREVVVDTQDVVAVIDQLFAKMRPDESRAAGNQNFHCPPKRHSSFIQVFLPSRMMQSPNSTSSEVTPGSGNPRRRMPLRIIRAIKFRSEEHTSELQSLRH